MAANTGYKIRKSQAGSAEHPYDAFSVTVPTSIGANLRNLDGRRWRWEWGPEPGTLLLREVTDGAAEEEVPEWA